MYVSRNLTAALVLLPMLASCGLLPERFSLSWARPSVTIAGVGGTFVIPVASTGKSRGEALAVAQPSHGCEDADTNCSTASHGPGKAIVSAYVNTEKRVRRTGFPLSFSPALANLTQGGRWIQGLTAVRDAELETAGYRENIAGADTYRDPGIDRAHTDDVKQEGITLVLSRALALSTY